MKKIFVKLCLVFSLCIFAFDFTLAQNVGIGTNTPKAALDVTSTTNGFLPPRMTFAQRNAINNPTAGLIVWCSDCGNGGELSFFNGTDWKSITSTTNSVALPSVQTVATNSITTSGAISGGIVVSDGGLAVTTRGICWSTAINPTVALTTKTINGSGLGTFTSNLTGLQPGTTYHIRAYATNSSGTAYGGDSVFTTPSNAIVIPTITTNVVTNISNNTATCGGNITADGGSSVTARGVCWSTNINPTVALNTKTFDEVGTGQFISNITGLSANTTYYVRAYATNSAGTAYGTQQVFTTTSFTTPTVSTTSVSNISYTTSQSGGNVTNDGGNPVTARGVCWSTTVNPTVSLSTKTYDETGTGQFTSTITNLTPNTIYYLRAYATNSVGTAYGVELTFTTASLTTPLLTTSTVTNITGTTAICGGNVTSDGGATVTSRGVCWSTNTNPTVSLVTKTIDSSGLGNFSSNITNLNSNTVYYIRAYATNSVGTSYGSQQTFTTSTVSLPTVTTTTLSNITNTNASGGGNVTADGGATVTVRGVCWSTSSNPTVSLSTKTTNGSGVGSFSSNITGLNSNTTYFVRAYATNSVGTAYGAEQTFITTGGTNISITPVVIGTQVWSSKNLSVNKYRNGDIIPQVTDTTQWQNLTSGAWCWYNNDSAAYAAKYGRLYNWYAVNDPRGLAPQGWRVSKESDWNKLLVYLDPASDTSCYDCVQSQSAGGYLKGTSDWITPNTGATNSTNFTSLPGGYRGVNGSYASEGTGAFFWCSDTATYGWYRAMGNGYAGVYRYFYYKNSGFSVRIVKDTVINPSLPTLTTSSVVSITATSAVGGGNISSDGAVNVTARGICWSTSPNPTIVNSRTTDGTGMGSFISNMGSLSPNTTYYVRAYATNSVGTAYGNSISFTTSGPTLATVTGATTTAVQATSLGSTTMKITCTATVSDAGGGVISARGFCWSTSENPTINLPTKITDGYYTTGTYNCTINVLVSSTTYYIRSFVTNSTGTSYGPQITVRTPLVCIGNLYQGGYVFRVDTSGSHGMVVATSDETGLPSASGSKIHWGCYTYNPSNNTFTNMPINTSQDFGTGLGNTIGMISNCGTASAAGIFAQSPVSWYLPSSFELKGIYEALGSNAFGWFDKYWSSSSSEGGAWALEVSSNSLVSTSRGALCRVRAVKSF